MNNTITDVIDNLSELPPFPKVTSRLLDLLNDPTVSINELSEVISTDPSLVLKVLHLSNSPFYMVSKKIESVQDAVFILGIHTIKTITTAITIHQGFNKYKPRADIFHIDRFWKHSYATAITACKLARNKKLNNSSNKLYLAGLIHDIGKLIISFHWPETWKRFINVQSNTEQSIFEIENEIFNTNHCEIAATLCARWQFPDDVVQMIRSHHDELDPTMESFQEKTILSISNDISKQANYQFPEMNTKINSDMEENYNDIIDELHSEVSYQFNAL